MADRQVAAVILAAGRSSRMGCNKLILEIGGKPMLRHVAEAAIASRARPVIAVVGEQSGTAVQLLEGLDIVFAEHPDFLAGISSSIAAGIRALRKPVAGALIMLGDMPAISASFIDRMVAAFGDAEEHAICVATYKGQRGHPVLFACRYFPDLLKLDGDVGARSIVAENARFLSEVEASDDAPLVDIDTPEALAALQARGI